MAIFKATSCEPRPLTLREEGVAVPEAARAEHWDFHTGSLSATGASGRLLLHER